MASIFDISVPISRDLPVWPGDPQVKVDRISKLEDGAESNVTFLQMSAHTGTHVDAPYHFLRDGGRVDEISPDLLVGPVQVVEVPGSFQTVDAKILGGIQFEDGMERILFKTKNSRYWEKAPAFQKDYCAIAADAAELLVEKRIRLIGVDYLSVAPFEDTYTTHEILLRAGIVLLEGINLAAVSPGIYELICMPLKIHGADGAPARAFLKSMNP